MYKNIKNKKLFVILALFLFSFLFLFGFISADIYDDCEIYGNCEPVGGTDIVPGANYTINVNNSNYLQGYTPTTLGSFLQSIFGWINWGDVTNGTLALSSDLNNYVPYNGANQNVNLGNNNLTVDDNDFVVNTDTNRTGIRTNDTTRTFNVQGNIRFDPQQAIAPTASLAGAGAGSLGNGAYRYAVVFVTDEGDGGAADLYSNTVTIVNNATDGKIQLTNIPIGNEYTIARKIYRTTAGGNQFLLWRVTTINNNVDTTYLDNVADGALITSDSFYRKPDQSAGLMYYGTDKIFETGNFNTFTGAGAGQQITTSNSNAFFGSRAGYSTTTGNNNAFFGYQAGYSTTTGPANNYFGYASGLYTNGDRNSGFGGNSLRADSTGGTKTSNYNIAMGETTLYNYLYSITGNIGIGLNAGYNIGRSSSANYNIIIGYHNTTAKVDGGDSNILIGTNVAPPTNNTNYFLNIGDLIKGVMSGSKYVSIEGALKQADSNKFYQGDSDDVSINFNGTSWNFLQEVSNGIWNFDTNNGLFNIISNTSISENLDVAGNITGNFYYGEMYANNVVQTVVIDSADVYYEITDNLTAGYLNGFVSGGNYYLNLTGASGMYRIDYSISAKTTSVANKEVESAIMINGVAQLKGTAHAEVSPGGSNRPETISGHGIFYLNSTSNKVSLAISNHNDGTDIVVEHASLVIERIGN